MAAFMCRLIKSNDMIKQMDLTKEDMQKMLDENSAILKQMERELKIEAALEEVRSRSLSMHEPDELQEVVAVVFEKLKELNIVLDGGATIITFVEGTNDEIHWVANPALLSSAERFYAPAFDHHTFMDFIYAKKRGEEFFSVVHNNDNTNIFWKYLFEHSDYKRIPEETKKWVLQAETFGYWAAFGKHEAILTTSFAGQTLPEKEWEVLKRFAKVFDQAYVRFLDLEKAHEDFNKLESAKALIEKTLGDLKQMQAQLIQSEKLASLGEHTAGIAHEIQNPLNFVNNFSDVNTELIDELNGERLKPKAERDEQLENEIINDIKENEQKINHHGKRADAIVKGMLQHSRQSSGQKEPTDINALADEYLRLSYHGLRAKDKTFNAMMKTDFDSSIGKVNFIPQDIGRVLLNLFNNAFYAVSEKQKAEGAKLNAETPYEPTISIATKKIDGNIFIHVQDNGNGIPQNMVDKIFQPFFTTKPTGEGTGLGLSLAYDIIKAHGGELKVETKEGEGTEFIIQLPVNN